jgi:hypothetical protein
MSVFEMILQFIYAGEAEEFYAEEKRRAIFRRALSGSPRAAFHQWGTMSNLADFLRGSGTRLGVFYPHHCLIAVFPNFGAALHALDKLRSAGFSQRSATVADGEEVIRLESNRAGVWAFFVKMLSRLLATEQRYTDHDLAHARHGAGFVAVRCRDESSKVHAWQILQPEWPLDARYYALSGIEHLAGDFRTV